MDDPFIPDHEIIEFPAVFLNSETLQVDFEFHAFVRPTEEPLLSEFCTELTGIDQATVSESETLECALLRFRSFLRQNRIESFTVCSDGPWDFDKFLFPECKRKHIEYPGWARNWLDVRKRFAHQFELQKWVGVTDMLANFDLGFEGRLHSGIDDARNIARIVKALHEKAGKKLRPNRKLASSLKQKQK